MAYIITRMPSTGSVTNLTYSDRPISEVRREWADRDCVSVLRDEEFATLPRCATCGNWIALGLCAECR